MRRWSPGVWRWWRDRPVSLLVAAAAGLGLVAGLILGALLAPAGVAAPPGTTGVQGANGPDLRLVLHQEYLNRLVQRLTTGAGGTSGLALRDLALQVRPGGLIRVDGTIDLGWLQVPVAATESLTASAGRLRVETVEGPSIGGLTPLQLPLPPGLAGQARDLLDQFDGQLTDQLNQVVANSGDWQVLDVFTSGDAVILDVKER